MEDPLRTKSSLSSLQAKETEDGLRTKSSLSSLRDGVINHSPSGRTTWIEDANGDCHVKMPVQSNPMAVVPHQYQHDSPKVFTDFLQEQDEYARHPRNSKSYKYINPHYSSADIYLDEIRNGRDVRTTVMLRNIPNNWTYRQLKERLDEFCFGLYDFSYLRIDFKRHTNVGYGFVNFIRAVDIIPLYEGLYGIPWARYGYGRHRLGDLSYATIQGLDCLVEKFRNSSVQSEAPPFKAKMWWTYWDAENSENASQAQSTFSNDARVAQPTDSVRHIVTPYMVGVERPFPPSDNEQKRLRSNANAAQNDLWTNPHGGGGRGHGRARGRGRGGRGGRGRGGRGGNNNNTMYDRGNTFQMQEDFYYANNMPYDYIPAPAHVQMAEYYQQYSGAGNNYQHVPAPTDNHRQNQNGGRRKDTRNDSRIPRSFSFENMKAAQATGRVNARGGQIYS